MMGVSIFSAPPKSVQFLYLHYHLRVHNKYLMANCHLEIHPPLMSTIPTLVITIKTLEIIILVLLTTKVYHIQEICGPQTCHSLTTATVYRVINQYHIAWVIHQHDFKTHQYLQTTHTSKTQHKLKIILEMFMPLTQEILRILSFGIFKELINSHISLFVRTIDYQNLVINHHQ